MHPSRDFQFRRTLNEYALWQAIAEGHRAPAPSWWWSSALASRDDPRRLPSDSNGGKRFAGMSYGDLAQRILSYIGAQKTRPWPDEFPTKYSSHGSDEAASSSEPAAQAASIAATPIS